MDLLTQDFYDRDTVTAARALLGKHLVRVLEDGTRIVCRITETEAYVGRMDKACHAYGYKRTPRTETLFAPPGTAYIYLIYGMYHCLNVVTEGEGEPCAVLIRGAEAVTNGDIIAKNRFGCKLSEMSAYQRKNFLNGPGKLCKGLALTRAQNGLDLTRTDSGLYICDGPAPKAIQVGKRIGIDYAEEAVDFPLAVLDGGLTLYFFDLDGTLLDSNGVWLDLDMEFLGSHGIDPVPPEYTDYVTRHSFPDAAVYTRDYFHIPLTPDEIMTVWRTMARAAYAGQLELKPGARDFLERAKAAGAATALVTSCMPDLCQSALESHGLTNLLDRVFTTAELGLEKHDPALFQTVAERCGQQPGDCLLFEDSPANCAAARAAGWQVFGVADPLFAHRAEEMAALCGPGRYPFSFLNPLP